MATSRAQLDAAIDTLVTTINTALTDLLAAVAAGQVTTPEDFTAELTKIQSLTSAGAAADPGPQAPPDASSGGQTLT